MDARHQAILLLGPTGSGKTPLGQLLERKGLGSQRCFHFDFGEELRAISRITRPNKLWPAAETGFIRKLLKEGGLLENEWFFLAEKILTSFISHRRIARTDYIVLNGLPRHVGQAENMGRIVNVALIIQLLCSPAVAIERIRANPGGDRTGRTDDKPHLVKAKISTYENRTQVLVEYYQRRGAQIRSVEVKPATTPLQLWQNLRHLLAEHPLMN